MKPLPFELPAVICPESGDGAAQREKSDRDDSDPDRLCSGIIALSASGQRKKGALAGLAADRECKISELILRYKKKMKALGKEGADFYYIRSPKSLREARAAILAARKTFSGPAVISFEVNDEGVSEFGSDAMALYVIAEGMGASAFGLTMENAGYAEMADVFSRVAPYARIPLLASGRRARELSDAFPQIGLFESDAGAGICSLSFVESLNRPSFYKRDPELILAASNNEAFFLDAAADFQQEIGCGPDFPEKILEAEEEGGGLKITVGSAYDVDILDQYQYMINRPVCFCPLNPEILEAALKAYNGRAFFDSESCDIDENYLTYLKDFYGVIEL
ncbi:MAG: hypothetical protein Q8878_05170 [Bacillota bacterium]|nr:hypothetical protein [Bacillota bacterium]